jgi:superfamily II DNA or RNA helicase
MKITIYNNKCYVECNYAESRWLSSVLTKGTGKRNFRDGSEIKHYFYNYKAKSFPTGLLKEVITFPGVEQLGIELDDRREGIELPEEPATIKGFEKREYQDEAVRLMLQKKRGTIQAATNSGKSLCLARFLKTIEKTGVRSIVFIHNQEIFEQLYETISKSVKSVVGTVLSKKTDCSHSQVTIAMVKTFANRLGEHKHVTKLYEDAQVIVADECHHLVAPTYQNLFLESNAPVRIGMSGTVPAEDTYQGWLVRSLTGPILIDITNKELIEAGISAKPIVEMHRHDSSHLFDREFYNECIREFVAAKAHQLPDGSLFRMDGSFINIFWKVQFFAHYQRRCIERGMIHNEKRNEKIVELVRQDPNKQYLIVTERLDHGDNMLNLFRGAGTDVEFVNGNTPGSDRDDMVSRFRKGELKVLISSTVLDEGVDIDKIETLVLAGVMKSKRALKQRIGRGLRKKKDKPNVLRVIDFDDIGNKYMERYSGEREEIWTSEGFEVTHVR